MGLEELIKKPSREIALSPPEVTSEASGSALPYKLSQLQLASRVLCLLPSHKTKDWWLAVELLLITG